MHALQNTFNTAKTTQSSPWLYPFSQTESKHSKIRLYCFPYAGGNANVFAKWPAALGNLIDVCAIALPGRWQRQQEPSIACIYTLAWEIATALRDQPPKPFVFLGHSMGALLAFEVIQELRRQGAMLPEHLFVSGAQAPHTLNEAGANRRKKVSDMDAQEFFNYLHILSGTPEALLKDPQMREYIMLSMRPDLQAIDDWHYKPTKPLQQNISVFVGADDPVVDISAAKSWRQHTAHQCDTSIIPGDHFFINTHTSLMAGKIKRILELENII
ncbi:MAG: hypothetical protein RL497_1780 [Pseudomonadota bacterium]